MLKKFFVVVSNILLLILFLVGILIAISILPIKNNFQILSVMSGSMEPTIKTGSLIIIKPANNYNVGDIITFITPMGKNSKDYTTHRIFSIDNMQQSEFYRTKGDANNTPDGWVVKKDDVIGKHLAAVPYAGYLITYIKTLPGLILIILIPAIIIIYEELRKIHHETKQIISRRRSLKEIKNENEENN